MYTTRRGGRGPITFANAPTREEDGVEVVEQDAALELARIVLEDHADLMAALSDR